MRACVRRIANVDDERLQAHHGAVASRFRLLIGTHPRSGRATQSCKHAPAQSRRGFAMDIELRRSISDIQSKLGSLDHRVLKLSGHTGPRRPGGLVARWAAVELLAKAEHVPPAQIAE